MVAALRRKKWRLFSAKMISTALDSTKRHCLLPLSGEETVKFRWGSVACSGCSGRGERCLCLVVLPCIRCAEHRDGSTVSASVDHCVSEQWFGCENRNSILTVDAAAYAKLQSGVCPGQKPPTSPA